MADWIEMRDEFKEIVIVLGMIVGTLLIIVIAVMITDAYSDTVVRDMMTACVQSDMQWIEGDCVTND